MATKHKHRTKQAAAGLVQQARRELEKGTFKQAVKDAKVCYRQAPIPRPVACWNRHISGGAVNCIGPACGPSRRRPPRTCWNWG